MKILAIAACAGLSLAACAHNNPTNTHADSSHEAPRAVDRVQNATNNAGPLVTDREVERTRQSTNTNAHPH